MAMMQEMSFSDFMKHLITLLHEKEVTMPLKEERPWHELFYQLHKSDLASPTFAFLRKLRFDWDGTYPKCQQLSEFLHALHWNAGVSAQNPRFMTMTLPTDVATLWKQGRSSLDSEAVKKLEAVAIQACAEFGSV